jgi:hypothetical protein
VAYRHPDRISDIGVAWEIRREAKGQDIEKVVFADHRQVRLDGRLPANVDTFTVILRRLDDRPETVLLSWLQPGWRRTRPSLLDLGKSPHKALDSANPG